jgi:hypothetical protein
MKIVIQCCHGKHESAGTFTNADGKKVLFVAHPELCTQPVHTFVRCRPDDAKDNWRGSWRDYLAEYNQLDSNPNGLFQATNLYKPAVYQALVEQYGWQNVFILSAGWGLIRADYLIPYYDITFSAQAEPCNRRRRSDIYRDFNHLLDCSVQFDESIYFFGGKDYLLLYYSLTQHIVARKVIYHSQSQPERRQGYEYIPYPPSTNWHYRCAQDFIAGRIHV